MKGYRILSFVVLGMLLALMVGACQKDTETTSQVELDEQIILDYAASISMPVEKHESGIYYNIQQLGEGEFPVDTSTVTVKYQGWLVSGTVFDETKEGKTATFALDEVILGWQIGLQLIKPGGKIRLYIPSALGYGSASMSVIPANSVLIFDVELLSFENVAH